MPKAPSKKVSTRPRGTLVTLSDNGRHRTFVVKISTGRLVPFLASQAMKRRGKFSLFCGLLTAEEV